MVSDSRVQCRWVSLSVFIPSPFCPRAIVMVSVVPLHWSEVQLPNLAVGAHLSNFGSCIWCLVRLPAGVLSGFAQNLHSYSVLCFDLLSFLSVSNSSSSSKVNASHIFFHEALATWAGVPISPFSICNLWDIPFNFFIRTLRYFLDVSHVRLSPPRYVLLENKDVFLDLPTQCAIVNTQ